MFLFLKKLCFKACWLVSQGQTRRLTKGELLMCSLCAANQLGWAENTKFPLLEEIGIYLLLLSSPKCYVITYIFTVITYIVLFVFKLFDHTRVLLVY